MSRRSFCPILTFPVCKFASWRGPNQPSLSSYGYNSDLFFMNFSFSVSSFPTFSVASWNGLIESFVTVSYKLFICVSLLVSI